MDFPQGCQRHTPIAEAAVTRLGYTAALFGAMLLLGALIVSFGIFGLFQPPRPADKSGSQLHA